MVALKHTYTHFLIYQKQYHEILIHIHLNNLFREKNENLFTIVLNVAFTNVGLNCVNNTLGASVRNDRATK